jgi:hypothetical protein
MVSAMGRRGALALLVVAFAAPALAIVPGGGPAKSDCYAVWQVTTPDLAANRGKIGIDCQDGDPSCDVDGQVDGRARSASRSVSHSLASRAARRTRSRRSDRRVGPRRSA